MKRLLITPIIILCLLFSVNLDAQTPHGIPYQALARNSSGTALASQAVSVRFTIHDVTAAGTVVYQEKQSTTTSAYGMFTVTIGNGTVTSGTFSSINWATGSKFLQVEIDPAGGTAYVNMGIQQLMSVPYALYAEKTASSTSPYGNGELGALVISANTDWSTSPPANLSLQYSAITVNAGVTLTVPSGLTLRSTGDVTINGTINVKTGTADDNLKPSTGVSIKSANNPYGGFGIGNTTAATSLIHIPSYGGGAGARNANITSGSEGGGSFRILAQGNITISGTILANGNSATNPQTAGLGIQGAGGGAGGLIVLLCKGTLTQTGTLQANGGNGSSGFDGNGGSAEGGGGGGGGGIIILSASTISSTGPKQVNSGTAGANAGASATITNGGGGGACGGNGGNAGSSSLATTPSAGAAGLILSFTSSNPENLVF
ncbi:MAG: hypothetical protein ACJ748_14210 [Flavisolibacter sp.]